MIRLDSNENPVGPGAHAFEAIRAALGNSNRYPVKAEDDLVAALIKVHGVSAENVILGCGSGELLRAAVQGFTSPDKALVVANPTFESPARFAQFINTPVRAVPVDSRLRMDLGAMASAAKGAGLVYYCNPNNPTSTVFGKPDSIAFIEQVLRDSPQTTVLVDEAYFEYVDDPSYGTLIPLALENPRVVVTRTFSKVFGMAGLRVGYAIGRRETLARMSAWLLGSNVSQLSLAAATEAVGDKAHIASEQRRNRAVRDYTLNFFRHAGFEPAACQANFMMVDIKRDAKAFKLECVKHNVAIGRAFPPLTTHVRLSFGTMPEMKKALQVFKATLV
jgi:histidinol-phosphate aminotransferase